MVIVTLLFVFCLVGTFTVLTRKKFEELLPVTLMASALICYLTGLAGSMKAGYILLLATAAFFPLYLAVLACQRKLKANMLLENVFTPGSIVFMLAFCFISVINQGRTIALWDEIMQWGPFAKEMFRLDQLFSAEASQVMIHKSYYPIISVLQVELCKLNGVYRDNLLFIATQTLGISCFIPCMKEYTWKSLKKWEDKITIFLLTAVILALPLIVDTFEARFYSSIYIDALIGMIFGFALYLCFTMDYSGFDWVALAVTTAFLVLTKDISIIFLGFLFVLLLAEFCRRKFYLKSVINVKYFTGCFCGTVLCSVLFRYSYALFLKINHVPASFTVDFSVKTLIKVLLGLDDTARTAVFHSFLHYLFAEPINNYAGGTNIQLSYVQMMILLGGLFALLAFFFKNQRKQIFWIGIYSELVAAGWAFACLNIFLFVYYRAVDGYIGNIPGFLTAYCYHRYVNTALVGLFLLLLVMTLKYLRELKADKINYILGALFVVMSVIVPTGYKYETLVKHDDLIENYYADAEFLQPFVQEGDVYIYNEVLGNSATDKVSLYYLLLPNHFDIYVNFFEKYEEYQYFYLYEYDENFVEQYACYFETRESIRNHAVYKVEKRDNNLRLVYVDAMAK